MVRQLRQYDSAYDSPRIEEELQKDNKEATISSLGEQGYSEDSYEQTSTESSSSSERESLVQLAKKVADEAASVD